MSCNLSYDIKILVALLSLSLFQLIISSMWCSFFSFFFCCFSCYLFSSTSQKHTEKCFALFNPFFRNQYRSRSFSDRFIRRVKLLPVWNWYARYPRAWTTTDLVYAARSSPSLGTIIQSKLARKYHSNHNDRWNARQLSVPNTHQSFVVFLRALLCHVERTWSHRWIPNYS